MGDSAVAVNHIRALDFSNLEVMQQEVGPVQDAGNARCKHTVRQ